MVTEGVIYDVENDIAYYNIGTQQTTTHDSPFYVSEFTSSTSWLNSHVSVR